MHTDKIYQAAASLATKKVTLLDYVSFLNKTTHFFVVFLFFVLFSGGGITFNV